MRLSWVHRRIEEPVTQHLEAEGLDFLQFTFRRAFRQRERRIAL